MALTVREAMALGGLRRGEVLAGASGLDRTITWVKVLESPETISWLAEGELVESSIALEDISFRLLASHVVPGVTDKHRQQTLAHHGTPLKVRQAAAIKNMLQEVVLGRAPRKVPPFPELGLTAPRIITPVLAGRETLGLLSIIDHPQHLEDLAMMAIEHAATVIALEMIQQREVAEAEDRVRA